MLCGRSGYVSESLRLCANCIRGRPEEAEPLIFEAHRRVRSRYGLPPAPPKAKNGIPCNLCANECVMGEGEKGYCGLRMNVKGRLSTLSKPSEAVLHAYKDPHVTNCCAAWFCPAGTGLGYPKYAVRPEAERGYANLAVFFYGCNFNCLFCQNWSHKEVEVAPRISVERLAERILRDPTYTCICFFGGSPEPQLPFALHLSRLVRESQPKRILRICFEWNGCGHPKLVRQAAELAYESGGNLKFDLKAFTPMMSYALSGVSNRRAYENFEAVYREFYERRREVPVLTATTLLVPGYVDEVEVEGIARFLAELDRDIPYSLLVFHPDFEMADLPVTPRSQVEKCYQAARRHLNRVNIGNLHLLSFAPP
ncbi:MAG: radical SAM protein [Candidatus Hecatellales archaeon]|nr:MAG: radical SAM protein [Candidatus Hecatellales archaeon]